MWRQANDIRAVSSASQVLGEHAAVEISARNPLNGIVCEETDTQLSL